MISINPEFRKRNLLLDMAYAYKNFAKSFCEKKGQNMGERSTLYLAFTAAIILFISNIPLVANKFIAFGLQQPSLKVTYFGILFFVTVFFVPLFLFFVGALLHLILRIFNGKGSFYDCRLALFWSINVSAPVLFLHGVLKAQFYYSDYLYLLNILFGVFVGWIMASMIAEAEKFNSKYPFFISASVILTLLEVSQFKAGV